MKRRQWDAKTKAKIVLEGLAGRPVSELCSAYGVGQTQYYKWRDQFLSESHRVFERAGQNGEVERLRKKTAQLQQIIGALTVDLKKSEDEL